jgi:DNA repair protein RecN (Recombination protein N)
MMIEELHIVDLALIDEAWIELGPGMTALTGETGAGKTVLLGALKLLIGERADATSVRAGAAEALVEGRFVDGSTDALVRRRVTADGRSRCTLDGEMATVGALADRIGPLVDLHGQHEHQTLLAPATHVAHLDAWAGSTLSDALTSYREARAEWRRTEQAVVEATTRIEAAGRDADRLRRLIAETDAVGPVAGEDETLEARLPALQHSERLTEAATVAAGLLRGEGGALDSLALAASALSRVAGIDPTLDSLAAQIGDSQALVDDAGSSIRAYGDAVEHDEGFLEATLARLSVLTSLKRAYGPTLDDVLASREEAARLLADVDDGEAVLKQATDRASRARAALEAKARLLADARRSAAPGFASAVIEITAELAMEGARIEIAFHETAFEQWTEDGPERVEFLYAPAPAQPARPLARIASGGEMSRVMLALKGVGNGGAAPILVFDEVDAGIGGAAATAVGARLAALARDRQVIVVTHLAQVAAFADAHLVVRKTLDQGSAVTVVVPVEGESRLAEISRMLSGDESAASLTHAAELLNRSRVK